MLSVCEFSIEMVTIKMCCLQKPATQKHQFINLYTLSKNKTAHDELFYYSRPW